MQLALGGGASLAPWREETRATLRLALPLIGAQLAFIALVTTNIVLLGRIGSDAIAASALGGSLINIVLIPCFGVVSATSALVARARGRNPRDTHMSRRILRMALWAAFLLSVPLAVFALCAEPLLLAIGQDPVLARGAARFTTGLAPGFFFALAANALRSYAAALGRPRPMLVISIVSIGLNAVVGYGLIFGAWGLPRLEILGAGLATSIINLWTFAALCAVVLFTPVLARPRPFANLHRPDWPRFAELFRIGVPAGLTSALEVAMFAAAALLMGLVGRDALAGHQVALNPAAVAFMVPLGLGMAATVRVGYGAGAGNPEAAARAGYVALALAIAFMSVVALFFLSAPRAIAGFFLDAAEPKNEAAFAYAVGFLTIAAAFQIFDGLQVVAAGALRGLKDTFVPMVLAGISYWAIGFASSVLFGFGLGWGGAGIWLGLLLGLAAGSTALVARFVYATRTNSAVASSLFLKRG